MLPHFANLLFLVAVKPAASFSAIALLGSFICWQLRPLASTSPPKPPQLIRRETGAPAIWFCFFFPSYHIAQPHLSFKRAPLSVPWNQWLQKLARCHPCSFHCLILQNPLTDCDVRRTIVWVYQKVILLYSTVLQKQTSWNLRLADDSINWSI